MCMHIALNFVPGQSESVMEWWCAWSEHIIVSSELGSQNRTGGAVCRHWAPPGPVVTYKLDLHLAKVPQ